MTPEQIRWLIATIVVIAILIWWNWPKNKEGEYI